MNFVFRILRIVFGALIMTSAILSLYSIDRNLPFHIYPWILELCHLIPFYFVFHGAAIIIWALECESPIEDPLIEW